MAVNPANMAVNPVNMAATNMGVTANMAAHPANMAVNTANTSTSHFDQGIHRNPNATKRFEIRGISPAKLVTNQSNKGTKNTANYRVQKNTNTRANSGSDMNSTQYLAGLRGALGSPRRGSADTLVASAAAENESYGFHNMANQLQAFIDHHETIQQTGPSQVMEAPQQQVSNPVSPDCPYDGYYAATDYPTGYPGSSTNESTATTQPENVSPVVQAPVVQAPVVQAPVVQAPVVQAPVVQAPVVQDAPQNVVSQGTDDCDSLFDGPCSYTDDIEGAHVPTNDASLGLNEKSPSDDLSNVTSSNGSTDVFLTEPTASTGVEDDFFPAQTTLSAPGIPLAEYLGERSQMDYTMNDPCWNNPAFAGYDWESSEQEKAFFGDNNGVQIEQDGMASSGQSYMAPFNEQTPMAYNEQTPVAYNEQTPMAPTDMNEVGMDDTVDSIGMNITFEQFSNELNKQWPQVEPRLTHFFSAQEARDYHRRLRLSTVPHDSTVPTSTDDICHAVAQIKESMKATKWAFDSEKVVKPFEEGAYNDVDLEIVAWGIYECLVSMHVDGDTLVEGGIDKKKEFMPGTFKDRLNAALDALAHSKSICKHLCDQLYLEQFCRDPEAAKKRVLSNKKVNDRKANMIRVGRVAAAFHPDLLEVGLVVPAPPPQ